MVTGLSGGKEVEVMPENKQNLSVKIFDERGWSKQSHPNYARGEVVVLLNGLGVVNQRPKWAALGQRTLPYDLNPLLFAVVNLLPMYTVQ